MYLANTVHPAFRLWFYPADISPSADIQLVVKDACRQRIETAWARIDRHIANSGPYLLGEKFSAADLLLIMFMRWSRRMPKPSTDWSALRRFAIHMKSRPSWKRLYDVEGLTEWA